MGHTGRRARGSAALLVLALADLGAASPDVPPGSHAIPNIVPAITPPVVNVSTRSVERRNARHKSDDDDDAGDPFPRFFERFFGGSRPELRRSLGSGVSIDPPGYTH